MAHAFRETHFGKPTPAMTRRPTRAKSAAASSDKVERDEGDSKIVRVFAANVTRLRKERGLDQKAFGELIGLDQPHVSAMERRGTNITIVTAERIARALGVAFVDLFKK
jgi:ribosome-binding protein aMBF1 (putative translation factor)